MNKTLLFTGLDFRLIKPYLKSVVILLAISVGMGIGFKSADMLSTMCMFMLVLTMAYPFTISDKNGLETLYGTLPMNKKTVVGGRYLFVLFMVIMSVITAFAGSFILSAAMNIDFVVSEGLFTICLLTGAVLIVVAMQYPVYFKFNYQKGKIMAMLPLLCLFFILVQLPMLASLFNMEFSWDKFIYDLLIIANKNPVLMYAVPVLIGLGFLYISYLISCRIYVKKDLSG